MIEITDQPFDPVALRQALFDPGAGGYCSFEGWVRNRNEGRTVKRLEYEAYEPLALTEGQKVLDEAMQKFPYLSARCVHRTGLLEIGECAVWVGVSLGGGVSLGMGVLLGRGVAVGVSVGIGVEEGVRVRVAVAVEVKVGLGVRVGVEVTLACC
jgi:hypothetical protein